MKGVFRNPFTHKQAPINIMFGLVIVKCEIKLESKYLIFGGMTRDYSTLLLLRHFGASNTMYDRDSTSQTDSPHRRPTGAAKPAPLVSLLSRDFSEINQPP